MFAGCPDASAAVPQVCPAAGQFVADLSEPTEARGLFFLRRIRPAELCPNCARGEPAAPNSSQRDTRSRRTVDRRN